MATNNCDGSYLKKIWLGVSSSEVFLKGKCIPQFPWGEEPHWALDDAPYQNWTGEIGEYCHVTHAMWFKQIKQEEAGIVKYIFKPRQKKGKDHYDKCYIDGTTITLRASYTPADPIPAIIDEDTQYRIIQPDEELLPGYYIWWGPQRQFNEPIPAPYIPSDFLKFPFSSVYGSKKVRAKSFYLFKSYQKAFLIDGNYPRLELRCGGTLRYKHEICYVIIVCTQGHFTGALNVQYPIIEPFNIRHKQDGEIDFISPWKITIRNGIQKGADVFYSWDQYTLAFHYPDDTKQMELEAGPYVKDETVRHDPKFCCVNNVEGKCPDEL